MFLLPVFIGHICHLLFDYKVTRMKREHLQTFEREKSSDVHIFKLRRSVVGVTTCLLASDTLLCQ